jgi:amino acid transporter
MKLPKGISSIERLKLLFVGKARDLYDEKIFHKMTLIAFFAWIGLGSDGLSSSCYGPEETYRVLSQYPHLSIFVGVGIVFTIFIISSSYSQIIKIFPSGGGGYKVATKLISPQVGMISGCALIIDYILTISISVASGTDALFSYLPVIFQQVKLIFIIFMIGILLLMNIRGIKESVISLMPIFIIFVLSHLFLIFYALLHHAHEVPLAYNNAISDFNSAKKSLGLMAVILLMLRSYTMGAGTYTGIEAVSNSLPILKEPRVKTGQVTMRYMAISLAFTVFGLLFAYSIFNIHLIPGKTANAVLLANVTSSWSPLTGYTFLWITLISEAALLYVAAQTGFLDGPRVIASMANDSWFPRRFAVLSDRLVTQNGVLFMGISAMIFVFMTKGSVMILVILYSINVFITFALSQTGMVRHWWIERSKEKHWRRKLLINSIGLTLTLFILITVITIKFKEGGWITLFITSLLIIAVTRIKKHYKYAEKLIHRFDIKMKHYVESIYSNTHYSSNGHKEYDPNARTAVVCVSGYNGLGIQTFLKIIDEFKEIRNIIFINVGIVDAGNFKGASEIENLKSYVIESLENYKKLAEHLGYFSEYYYALGTDVADEIKDLAKPILRKYHDAIFFVGQFIIPKSSAFTRMLHNQAQFAIHNRLSHKGIIMVMIPVKFYAHSE